jgi:hypothetical protein
MLYTGGESISRVFASKKRYESERERERERGLEDVRNVWIYWA